MKITILTHLDKPDDTTRDVVVDQVAAALRQTDHQPSILAVHDDLRQLINGLTLRMDGSFGIGEKSLVTSATDMMKRIVEIHDKVHDAALVEEFIEGREFYLGVLGNQNPTVFPPIEMDFSGLPDGTPHVLGSDA